MTAEDEDVLRDVGEQLRERDGQMPQWEAVTAGRMSVDDALAQMRQDGTEPRPSAELADALFTPFTPEEEGALVEHLLTIRDDPARGDDDESDEGDEKGRSQPAPPSLQVADDADDGVGGSAGSGGSRAWIWGAVAAAAALILGGLWSFGNGDGDPSADQPAVVARASSMPTYALEFDGQVRGSRSSRTPADGGRARFAVSAPLLAVLRPASSGGEDSGLRLCALSSAGEVLPLEVQPRRSGSGSFRVAATPEAMGLSTGEWTLVFLVGDPAALVEVDLEGAAEEDFEGPWQVIRAEIEVLP